MSSTAAAHAVWLSAPLQALVVSTCIAIAAALTDRQLRFELKITVDPSALVFRFSSTQNDMGSKPIRTPAGWTPARLETSPGGHTVFSDLDPSAPIPSLAHKGWGQTN